MIAVSLAGTLFFAADHRRPARQRRALPAGHDGAVRRRWRRSSARRWTGCSAAAGGRWPAASLGRAVLALVMAAPLRRPLALPGGARRAGAVEGAQRAARRRRPAGAAAGHVADLGERPAVGVRAGHRGRRRRRRRRHRRGCSASPGSCGATAVVFARRRGARRPAARGTSTCPTGELPADVLHHRGDPGAPGRRRRAVSPHVVLALRANAALRGLGGFLTIFAAFLVQATFPGGWEATLALGAIAAAAGRGQLRRHRPPARGCTPPTPTGWCCSPRPRRPRRSPCWRRSSSASPMAAVVALRLRGHQRAGQGRRSTRSSSARCPRACGPRRSRGRRPCCSWPGWSAARSASRCPPTGWLGLHRRRGAARPRRRPDRLEPVPRTRRGRSACRTVSPDAPTTPVGPQWS